MIILQKPIITEKSMRLAGVGLYTFVVSKNANKVTIAKAVTEKFKVKVLAVKIVNIKGEKKSQRKTRKYYQTPSFKKALVQVSKGQTIPVFESPKEEEDVHVTTAESESIIKEKKNILRNTKVKIEKAAVGATPITQRKVITGK